jgi:hypothetical protein
MIPWSKPGNHPKKIIIHWSAGRYSDAYPDYTFIVMGDPDGQVRQNYSDQNIPLYATWHDNTDSVDIAAMCAYGATLGGGMGDYPPTSLQKERIAYLAAQEAHRWGIPIDPENVFTHCEIAKRMGYGPGSDDPDTRWDFINDGDWFRQKAKWYLMNRFQGK